MYLDAAQHAVLLKAHRGKGLDHCFVNDPMSPE